MKSYCRGCKHLEISYSRGEVCTHAQPHSLRMSETTLTCTGYFPATRAKETVEKPATVTDTFEKAVDSILAELRELMISKQKDYGPGNILSFGEYGVLVRVNDKVERLKNLHKAGRNPNNESIDDTWKDIANYGIISLMVRRNIFNLPLGDDTQA